MSWWKLFKPKCCAVRLAGEDKEAILDAVVENLVKGGCLPEDLAGPAGKALREREQMASTGVGMNIAIPHVKLARLARVACNLSVLERPVEWAAVDGAPVQILFTVLRPERPGRDHDPEKHLEMMRGIAKIAREPDFRRFALRARTKTELVGLLKEMATV